MDFTARLPHLKQFEETRAAPEAHKEDLARGLDDDLRAASESATIHILPDDVLKLIFEDAYEHKPREPCTTTSPLDVTHVSRRWRQVAVSLPSLWRCIHVRLSTPLVDLYLSRTGELSFRIIDTAPGAKTGWEGLTHQSGVVGGSWRPSPQLPLYLQRLVILLEHSDRISHIHIETYDLDLFSAVLPMMQEVPMPRLEYLELYNGGVELAVCRSFKFRPQSPALEQLRVTHIRISSSSPFYQNLQVLHIEIVRVRIQELCTIAKAAPRLKTLCLDNCLRSAFATAQADHIASFPCLESLTIRGDCDYERVLDCCSAPALSCLTVGFILTPLMSNLQLQNPHPFPFVHRICLHKSFLSGKFSWDYDIFRYTPNATTVELKDSAGDLGPLLQYLAATQIPLPSLEALTVIATMDFNRAVLLDLVERRAHDGFPLKELTLGKWTRDGMDTELLRLLESHVRVSVVADWSEYAPYDARAADE